MSSAGLMTQVLPQTSAGKSFHEGMAMGKFQGAIMPQTPTGIPERHGEFVGQLGRCGLAEEAAAFAGHVIGGVDGFLHVAAGLGEDLPHFAGHVVGVLLFAAEQENFAAAIEDFGALGRGGEPPGLPGFGGGVDGVVDVSGVRFLEFADDIVCGWRD